MKLDELIYDSSGLIPAIIQDQNSKAVLMVGYMNVESLKLTLETGRVHFYSRSRKQLWLKGQSSGNFLLVYQVFADCDGDSLLVEVNPTGPVCHTGKISCFDNHEPLESS